MTKKIKANDKAQASTTRAASLSGDSFTLAQVAVECVHFQTDSEALSEKKGTLSDHFMSAAKMYIKDKPVGEMAVDHPFLVACKAQEMASKSKEAGINQWDKVPAAWSQMKSNIKASYNMGIDINEYEQERPLRDELNKQRKAKKDAEATKEGEQVDEALQDAVNTVSPEVALRLFAIVNQCKDMTDAQERDIVRILDESLENIVTMKEIAAQFDAEEMVA